MSTPEIGLNIKIFGSPVLREKARPVSRVTAEHALKLSQMAQLMYASSGIGLAAPQIGVAEAMIVADCGSGLYKVINPKIVKRGGRQANVEGCLSVPGVCIKVRRARKVTVKGLDENAKPVTIDAEDLLACVFQHEIDHLRGKLIVDYASFLEKLKIKRKLRELKSKSKHEELPQSETKSCPLQL
jgi:peptide deformylase